MSENSIKQEKKRSKLKYSHIIKFNFPIYLLMFHNNNSVKLITEILTKLSK